VTTLKRLSKSCSWARSIWSHTIQSSILDQVILLLETSYAKFKNVATMATIQVSSLMWLCCVDWERSLTNPWFFRIWVLQELVLSRGSENLMGPGSLHLESLELNG
jgi:hypothetical protein